MKVFKILTTIILTSTLLLFTACDIEKVLDTVDPDMTRLTEEEKAAKINDAVNSKMDSLEAYSYKVDATLEATVAGKEIKVTMESTTSAKNLSTSDILYLTETSTITESDGNRTCVDSVYGFQNGRLHMHYASSENVTEMCSALSAADFRQALNEGTYDTSLPASADDFSEIKAEKLDDGWKLTYSQLKSENVADDLISELGLDLLYDGIDVENITLTITADSEYRCIDMTYDISFKFDEEEADDSALTVKVTGKYLKYDDANVENINITNYPVVNDLRHVRKAKLAFNALKRSTDMDFLYTVYAQTTDLTMLEVSETDRVDYTLKDGKPMYVILMTQANGNESSITYSSGKKIVTSGGASATVDSDNRAERIFINSLLLPFGFDESLIYNVSESNDDPNTFYFDFKTTLAQRQQILGSAYASRYDCTVRITVTYNGDKIEKYTTQLSVSPAGSPSKNYLRWTVSELSYE